MNKDEYIILNKTDMLKRLEECDKKLYLLHRIDITQDNANMTNIAIAKINAEKAFLKEWLSNSIELNPVIEKAYRSGFLSDDIKLVQSYLGFLKLDI